MPQPPARRDEDRGRDHVHVHFEHPVTIEVTLKSDAATAQILAALQAIAQKLDQVLAQPAALQALGDKLTTSTTALEASAATLKAATAANKPA